MALSATPDQPQMLNTNEATRKTRRCDCVATGRITGDTRQNGKNAVITFITVGPTAHTSDFAFFIFPMITVNSTYLLQGWYFMCNKWNWVDLIWSQTLNLITINTSTSDIVRSALPSDVMSDLCPVMKERIRLISSASLAFSSWERECLGQIMLWGNTVNLRAY